MSRGPEANFWNQIKKNLPKRSFATRIENKHGGGIPDAHIIWDGRSLWFELKVAKGMAVNLSPHQIAWNMAYFAAGGNCFYLVKSLSLRKILLFDGSQGPALSKLGLSGCRVGESGSRVGSGSGPLGRCFDQPKDLYQYLDIYFNEKRDLLVP